MKDIPLKYKIRFRYYERKTKYSVFYERKTRLWFKPFEYIFGKLKDRSYNLYVLFRRLEGS